MALSTKTLSELLGVEIVPALSVGEKSLLAFSARYPDEMTYEEGSITFCTEDYLFSIETDEDENGKAVYKATCTCFAPKTTLVDTGWLTTIPKTMTALKLALAKLD